MDKITENITARIKELKKDGIPGMSINNLFQATPTAGVTVPVPQYRPMFEEAAFKVAKKLRFNLYR